MFMSCLLDQDVCCKLLLSLMLPTSGYQVETNPTYKSNQRQQCVKWLRSLKVKVLYGLQRTLPHAESAVSAHIDTHS